MPAIVNCPKCDAQVSLPVGAHPAWQVRCPLCEKDFPLAEALDKAPPELIVVDRAGAMATGAATWDDRPTTAPSDNAALPDIEIAFDAESVDFHGAASATEQADAEDAVPLEIADGYGTVSGLSPRAMPQSTRGGHRMVGRFAGIVGGGVVGLMLGYYALLWLGGPSRDFLDLGPRLPSFVLPAEFRTVAVAPRPNSDSANGTSASTAAKGNGHGSEDRGPFASEPNPTGPFSATPDAPPVTSGTAFPVDSGDRSRTVSGPNWEPATHPPPAAGQATAPASPLPWTVSPGPAFSLSAVNQALDTATSAAAVLATRTLKDKAARPAMGRAYRDLCGLAEAVTYPEDGINPVLIQRRRSTAAGLVLELVQDRAKRGELALIGNHWIDASQRSSGIVLAGRVVQLQPLRIALADTRTVTVLSSRPPRLAIGDQAIVLGSIVDRPAADSAAFHGDDQVNVRAGVIRQVVEPTPDSA